MKLTKDTNVEEFLKNLKTAFNLDPLQPFRFGIVGLHPCGDLAALLLKIFNESIEAIFINLVGCCYMKLTTNDDENKFIGYPLSFFLKEKNHSDLSYESREIACHAKELYVKKLMDNNYDDLKIHSYRAAIETIIVKYYPYMKHTGLRNVKHKLGLSFEDYCFLATRDLNINLPNNEIDSNNECIKSMLDNWKNVMIFYTLRLMFAPLVESIILKDRILSVLEKGFYCKLEANFDPVLSPRNHIMTVIKR